MRTPLTQFLPDSGLFMNPMQSMFLPPEARVSQFAYDRERCAKLTSILRLLCVLALRSIKMPKTKGKAPDAAG